MDRHKKTFILGVGAQKAGTTWLSAYLEKSEFYQHGMCKEYHIWDVLFVPGARRKEKDWVERNKNNTDIADRRLKMLTKPSDYFAYFEELLNSDGKTIVADITPEYAGLKADELQYIKSEFEKRGIHTKVVFLMRDPFQRCWSNIKMDTMYILNTTGVDKKSEENQRLVREVGNVGMQRHTRYNLTIEELEKTFSADDIYYGIFEEQFEKRDVQRLKKNVERLSHFLGVEPKPQFVSVKVNVTEKGSGVEQNTIQTVVNEYKDVYRYCEERFPQVKELWSGFDYL